LGIVQFFRTIQRGADRDGIFFEKLAIFIVKQPEVALKTQFESPLKTLPQNGKSLTIPFFPGQEWFTAVKGDLGILTWGSRRSDPLHSSVENLRWHHWSAVGSEAIGAMSLTGHGGEQH
jgi:hypothetical protein